MADIILTPIAELIVETLGSAAVQEIKSVYGARCDLTKLGNTLSTIRAVLVDAEKRQIREEQVRDWLEKLEEVLFDADDLVDEVATEGERQKLMPGKKIRKKVRTFFSSNNQLVFRHKMARRIKDIRGRLDAVSADRERFHFATLTEETQLARRVRDDSHSFVVEGNVVGRDEDRKAILDLLLDPMEKLSVIPIVGMGGLGKTTLAQLVFNDNRVPQQHFDLKIWVCVSNDFNVKVLCEKILKIITNESIANLEMEQLQQKLREKINEKRYLLVLDDVWSKDSQTWKELKGLLTASCAKGSRVIITTRIHTVAKVMGTMEPYDLGILDSKKSWNLFKKMADHHEIELTNATLVDIAKGILAKCGGLPLAISMIGNTLLCSRNPETDWPSFLENDYLKITEEKEEVLKTLKLSYDYLPSHLKPCFVYCSLFLKDYDFDVQTLITLWIAQGFIKPSQSQSLEEIGYEYFRDLLSRSFFQEAKKDELNRVTTCKMHDLVHDLAILVAGEKYATLASCEMPIPGKVRHISLSFESDPLEEVPNTWLQAQRIRSFLFPSDGIKLRRSSMWDVIIRHYKFLRMLDLHEVGIERLSNSIGKLRHLRYLDLSENGRIETLPTSITKLVNLQTLKLNRCYKLRELPSEIDKIVNLRHLEFKYCDEITHMPRGLSQLSNLQTLSAILLSENVPSNTSSKLSKLDELMGLNNLKDELTIRGIRRGMETTVTKLRDNKHLRSLYLHFGESNDDASSSEQQWKATIEGLQPHTNLKKLTLDDYGGASLYSFLSSLTNLVELTLDGCSKCRQLPSLDKFHSLKRMSLEDLSSLEYITVDEGDSYFSTSSSPIISVLPSLQTLNLNQLPNFRGWWRSDMVENQVEQVVSPLFPRLSSLIIKNCPKLTSMPCYPNVGKRLKLEKTSWKHFERTMLTRVPQPKISVKATTELGASSSSVASSSTNTSDSVSSYSFSRLKALILNDIVDLQYLSLEQAKSLASLELLCIKECPKLKYLSLGIQSLPSIRRLTIDNCEEFERIKWPETPVHTSLLVLRLRQLPKLEYLVPPGIQHLTSLQELTIEGCEELQVSNDDSIEWQALKSLRTLEFLHLPQLVTLPDRLQFVTTLEDLEIEACDNFTGLPDWICKLCSLDSLFIWSCPNFKSVPRSVSSITYLQSIVINGRHINPSEIQEDLDVSLQPEPQPEPEPEQEPEPEPRKASKEFRPLQLCKK